MAADGQRVEQRLGRVLVGAVAGVDHRTVDLARQEMHGAGGMVADHQQIRVHGVQGGRRVDQRLALLHRGGGDRHVHHVGAEALAGKLEGGLGPGRGLEKQVDLGPATQDGLFLFHLAVELDGGFRPVQKPKDILRLEPFDAEQMSVGEKVSLHVFRSLIFSLGSGCENHQGAHHGACGNCGLSRWGSVALIEIMPIGGIEFAYKHSLSDMLPCPHVFANRGVGETFMAIQEPGNPSGEDGGSLPEFATHDVFNQAPDYGGANLAATDPVLIAAQGEALEETARSDFLTHGAVCGMREILDLGRLANEHKPELVTHDKHGRRADRVDFHPAYHALMRRSVEAGLHCAVLEEEKLWAQTLRAGKYFLTFPGGDRTLLPESP